jgi:hypothetical protein
MKASLEARSVLPDRITRFFGSFIQNTAHSTNTDGGITKNHRRPECVWPEANGVCPRVAKARPKPKH